MGTIVQTQQHSHTGNINLSTQKQQPFLTSFEVVKMSQGGHAIVRYEQNKEGLYVNKRIPEPVYHSQKENLLKWVKTNSKNSCNILQYTIKDESFFCSSHVNFKAIMEYSDCNLSTLLKSMQSDCELEQLQLSKRQTSWSNPLQILNIIKFCMETAEQHHENTQKWPIFHTTNILYFKKQKQLKFLYLPVMDQSHQHEMFFDPQSQYLLNKQSQQSTVFSIGMIVLSFLIKEDCSECYDYQRFQFCQSVFEEKLQKLHALSAKNPLFNQLSFSHYGVTLEEQLIEFASCATSPLAKRPTFSQLKRKYFKLLRQISLGCQSASCVSTKRGQRQQKSLLRSKGKRLEVNPFQTRQPLKPKRGCSDTEDTFELRLPLQKHKEKARMPKKGTSKLEGEDQNKENVRTQQYG